MGDNFIIKTSEIVSLTITNSGSSAVVIEKKFDKKLSIAEFKNKLEIITGGNAGSMQLELFNGDKLITKLDNNDVMLGSYPIEDGYRVHVVDNFQYIENVPKFELSDDQYTEKRNTVRDYLRTNKLGKYNEEEQKKMEEKRLQEAEEEERLAKIATVGSRCMVKANGPRRIGTIMYNGPFHVKPGVFIGVKFDEPLGVNDGSVQGKRYFECANKYGSMVPVSAVTVGDFPPEEFELDEI